MAVTTYMRHWADFDFVQLAILPMFLLSGTFFPISVYPPALQVVVQASPLYHSVTMVRQLMIGPVTAGIWVHVAVLVAMGLIGTVWTALRIEKLLLK
jgi:lipooligosaccharide transport system permease protein